MVPLLQTMLFGTFTPPPSTNTITHLIQKDRNPRRYKAPLGESTLQLRDTLTGNKWWSVTDLIDYMGLPKTTICNHLARHSEKLGVESCTHLENKRNIKYYRIKQNGF